MSNESYFFSYIKELVKNQEKQQENWFEEIIDFHDCLIDDEFNFLFMTPQINFTYLLKSEKKCGSSLPNALCEMSSNSRFC